MSNVCDVKNTRVRPFADDPRFLAGKSELVAKEDGFVLKHLIG